MTTGAVTDGSGLESGLLESRQRAIQLSATGYASLRNGLREVDLGELESRAAVSTLSERPLPVVDRG